jgi:ribonucleoside-diphosphate reductase alpha chain
MKTPKPLNDNYFLLPAHLEVAKARYFRKDSSGLPVEKDISEVFQRETAHIYQNDPQHSHEAYRLRAEKKILPAGRPLAQSGTEVEQLFNCLVLEFEDDTREAISNLKSRHMSLQAQGAGIGINFSTLRPRGSICKRAQTISSGSVGFITDISYQAANLQQGGNRSGANLGVLSDTHPDLYDFITYKATHNWESIRHFAHILDEDMFTTFQWSVPYPWQTMNVSVLLSDKFMERIVSDSDDDWILNWEGTPWFMWEFEHTLGKTVRKIVVSAPTEDSAFYKASAQIPFFNTNGLELINGPVHYSAKQWYHLICQHSWQDGCPGVLFIDTARNFHNIEYMRPLSAANACQPAWAPVLTWTGMSTIGQIIPGEVIWSGTKWTKVTNKQLTGVKPVYAFETTAGIFYGTPDHQVIEKGERVLAENAIGIDQAVGPEPKITIDHLSPQDIMDGLVIGDGGNPGGGRQLQRCLYIGENDKDYHASEITNLIREEKPYKKGLFIVSSTLELLPPTYNRSIPDRFVSGSSKKLLGFLRGLFSANGGLSGQRITLKATSYRLIRQAQTMLSSVGIPSYITTNKQKDIKFSNGIYTSKESYDINITRGRDIFLRRIGFIQKYKQSALEDLCASIQPSHTKKTTYSINNIVSLGEQEVFDITVEDQEHVYWTGGMLVSNCSEIPLPPNGVCNLKNFSSKSSEKQFMKQYVV